MNEFYPQLTKPPTRPSTTQTITIKRPIRNIDKVEKPLSTDKPILTVEDAIAYFAKKINLEPALLDIMVSQNYPEQTFKDLTKGDRLTVLSCLLKSPNIVEFNNVLTSVRKHVND
jgi:hypothetical protein